MNHVVIAGAGISGLLAAHALSSHAGRITLLDRDGLGLEHPRRGVGQTPHLHVLLQRGRDAIEELFPGVDEELREAGAPELDWGADTAWFTRHGWFPRQPAQVKTRSCSRELLEATLRKRTLALPNVQARERHEIHDLESLYEKLGADLVIDARGRAGSPPGAQTIDASVGYASCLMEIPAHAREDFRQLNVQMRPPRMLRGGVLIPLENGLHLVTLIGAGGDHPSTEPKAFVEFARLLAHPLFHETIRQARFAGPIHAYRRTAARRADLRRNSRILAIGDARCAFNPVYGQGMTLAALTALELAKNPRQTHEKLARLTRLPWLLGSSEDLRVPRVRTERLGLPGRALLKLVPLVTDRLICQAVKDPAKHRRFLRVLHLLESPL